MSVIKTGGIAERSVYISITAEEAALLSACQSLTRSVRCSHVTEEQLQPEATTRGAFSSRLPDPSTPDPSSETDCLRYP